MPYDPNREDMPSENRLRELLVGRKVIQAKKDERGAGLLTLDNGTILKVGGNEGCGGCSSGWYDLAVLNTCDNAITNVEVEEPEGDEYDREGEYRIFVFADARTLLASFDGSDGKGDYGTGWWLSVVNP